MTFTPSAASRLISADTVLWVLSRELRSRVIDVAPRMEHSRHGLPLASVSAVTSLHDVVNKRVSSSQPFDEHPS